MIHSTSNRDCHIAHQNGLKTLEHVLAQHAPGGQSQLLPTLLAAQRLYGYLPEEVAAAAGRALGVPLAEVNGVIEFYSMLYKRPIGRNVVRVCTGPRCVQLGGETALKAACDLLAIEPGETTPDGAYTVEEVPCLCLCDQAPAALVNETPVAHIDPEKPETWLGLAGPPPAAPLGFIGGASRWKTGRCGVVAPTSLPAYEASGGLAGLRRALQMAPAEVVAEIKASGLVGRGGAAFPTGLKWEMATQAPGENRYVVCNADESEPGTFKDRVLLEGDPFALLEGILIAAYAIGARHGYIYVRGEYPRAQAILQQAITAAQQDGLLGENVLGTGFSFDLELRSGAGAYICGEETALFESIEGKRGFPRLKPPYPTTHGLFGRPTVINNVETLSAATWILAHGAEAYRAAGTPESPGTKLFCLSGDVAQPGVYEAPFGISLGALIDLAGGATGPMQAVLLGGAAGAFVGPDQLDLPMSFEGLRAAGLALGSGVVMVVSQQRDLRQTLLSLARFFSHESCGKCYPCRLGTQRQLEIIHKVAAGTATPAEVQALRDVIFTMTNASLCGLGTTAGTAVLSALEKWPDL